MEEILIKIRKELEKNIDKSFKRGFVNFFKEKVNPLGVRTPIVRKISSKYFKEVKNLRKKEIFNLCENLLDTSYYEETIIAFDWIYRIKESYSESDFLIFEKWLKKYVNNWAFCDDFCTHSVGYLFFQFPEFLPKLKVWAKSNNRWLRRASAVSFIYLLEKERCLKESFEIADILLLDEDDMVRKGYGWMLKVANDFFPEEVFNYVMQNKKKMPRVSLRYAIEKMPKGKKREAMKH